MPNYLHPGVYIEERPGGARPIEAAGTSTAAFVGIADRGPIDEPMRITNFEEFKGIYGSHVSDTGIGKSYLAYSVQHFFQNGGTACYVVRVEDEAKIAECKHFTENGDRSTTVIAASPGEWGNRLSVAIGPNDLSNSVFDMYVIENKKQDGKTIVEQWENLSMVDSSPRFVDRVTRESSYIRTESNSKLSDAPTFIGRKDITQGVNLTTVNRIILKVDEYEYEIDCSKDATDLKKVTGEEIVKNINRAFVEDVEHQIATFDGKRVQITSPTATKASQIVFTAPNQKDATYDIFDLQESSWQVNAEQEEIAQVLGTQAIDLSEKRTLRLALGNGADVDVDILGQSGDEVPKIIEAYFAATKRINTLLGNDIAYTDGKHLVLLSREDIHIRRPDQAYSTDVQNIFPGFYSYVHTGSGVESVTIEGDKDVPDSAIKGQLRLKIDEDRTFIVKLDVNTGDEVTNAESIAKTINTAYQSATGGKKKVAEAKGAKIRLKSVLAGKDGGRIIVSSHTGLDDVADTVLGGAYKNGDDFLVPAEPHWVARLDGKQNFAPTNSLTGDLGKKWLRLSAASQPVQFQVDAAHGAYIYKAFETFRNQVPLNYKLLARQKLVTSTSLETTVHLIAVSLTDKPELHFSIPLKLTESLETDETAEHEGTDTAYKAYVRLFGEQELFKNKPLTRPDYTFRFGKPDNNPRYTFVKDDEDAILESVQRLQGGAQNRSNQSRLMRLTSGDLAGDDDKPAGLKLLDKLTDVSLLVIPGWSAMDHDTATRLINAGTEYCDKQRLQRGRHLQDLFYITNTPKDVKTPTRARDFTKGAISRSAGGYTAIYYPWVEVADPIGKASTTIEIPPAGGIAGLYATTDSRRGVWKSPAGTEAHLAGVMRVVDQVTDAQQDILNPASVNAIRRLSGAGVVSWGARTLHTNAEWKYVAVRRTAIMLEVSITEDIQWAVFEPNDERLWSTLRLNIESFLNGLFRAEAFQGNSASEAYFVRCGLGDTMKQGDIDRGQVIVLVGFAPLKPAEFVIVRIQQKAGEQ